MPTRASAVTESAPRISWASDCCVRIECGADAGEATHRRVQQCFERLRASRIAGLRDLTPAYCTVLAAFDPSGLDAAAAQRAIEAALAGPGAASATPPARTVEIPVCYEPLFAPDLEELAHLHGVTPAQVIERHAAAQYTVRFIGFVPGFAYLGGLPAELATPRLPRPRTRVPAGSVGIAGEQTGIYPFATPGGWRLIGRTPGRMFDAGREPPSVLVMGDRVRFVPIDAARFASLSEGGG